MAAAGEDGDSMQSFRLFKDGTQPQSELGSYMPAAYKAQLQLDTLRFMLRRAKQVAEAVFSNATNTAETDALRDTFLVSTWIPGLMGVKNFLFPYRNYTQDERGRYLEVSSYPHMAALKEAVGQYGRRFMSRQNPAYFHTANRQSTASPPRDYVHIVPDFVANATRPVTEHPEYVGVVAVTNAFKAGVQHNASAVLRQLQKLAKRSFSGHMADIMRNLHATDVRIISDSGGKDRSNHWLSALRSAETYFMRDQRVDHGCLKAFLRVDADVRHRLAETWTDQPSKVSSEDLRYGDVGDLKFTDILQHSKVLELAKVHKMIQQLKTADFTPAFQLSSSLMSRLSKGQPIDITREMCSRLHEVRHAASVAHVRYLYSGQDGYQSIELLHPITILFLFSFMKSAKTLHKLTHWTLLRMQDQKHDLSLRKLAVMADLGVLRDIVGNYVSQYAPCGPERNDKLSAHAAKQIEPVLERLILATIPPGRVQDAITHMISAESVMATQYALAVNANTEIDNVLDTDRAVYDDLVSFIHASDRTFEARNTAYGVINDAITQQKQAKKTNLKPLLDTLNHANSVTFDLVDTLVDAFRNFGQINDNTMAEQRSPNTEQRRYVHFVMPKKAQTAYENAHDIFLIHRKINKLRDDANKVYRLSDHTTEMMKPDLYREMRNHFAVLMENIPATQQLSEYIPIESGTTENANGIAAYDNVGVRIADTIMEDLYAQRVHGGGAATGGGSSNLRGASSRRNILVGQEFDDLMAQLRDIDI